MKTNYKLARRRNSPFKKRRLVLIIACALFAAAAALMLTLELTDTTCLVHKCTATSSTITQANDIQYDNVEKGDSDDSQSDGSTVSESTSSSYSSTSNEDKDTSVTSDLELIAPYGNFVSNHRPGQNGSPTTETSVCTTTPGAECYIRFTYSGDSSIVKTLAAGTADSNGNVYWSDWDVKEAGFVNGTWQIEAFATLGGKTVSTADTTTFEVQL